MYKVAILTLFPDMFPGILEHSITGRAKANGLWDLKVFDIRQFAKDRHKTADDSVYGGGAGMLMKPELVAETIKLAKQEMPDAKVIYLTPTGTPFSQKKSIEFANLEGGVILLCGHYEGIDQRVIDLYVDYEVSIGDYVLTGGEVAVFPLVDAILRNVEGVLGNSATLHEESFDNDLLEYPHYTRPVEFEGLEVPGVLKSGNHAKIAQWRLEKAIEKTKKVRPDLYKKYLENKEK
ncbi:MAG TPA: tRNA (guanosine(37)-N1)-methyltransferase TrmD [Alphaproteobacteria bacterium]|nr:tRNA (guanosine(37)-N1)-methyltransferase TrmD [Alphaproteobacteria bacterium]